MALRPAAQPPSESILLGGSEERVRNNLGAEETVKVILIPMRLRLRFIELCIEGDGQGIIELCCGERPPQWADRFPPAVQDYLLEKAKALNFTLALQYLERMQSESKALAPLYEKVAKRMIDQAGPLLRQLFSSFTPSPTSASPSAAPAPKPSTSPQPGSASSSSEPAPPTPAAPSSSSMP